jgi:WD40 repeat protein
MKDMRIVKALNEHKGIVLCICMSEDGKFMASGDINNKILLWDFEVFTCKSEVCGHYKGISCLVFANEGRLVSGAWDGIISIFDVTSKKNSFLLLGHKSSINCMIFICKDNLLVTGSDDKTIRLWDLQEKRQIFILQAAEVRVNCLVFAPISNILIYGSGDSTGKDNSVKTLHLNSYAQETLISNFRHPVNTIEINPAESLLFTGSSDIFAIYHLTSKTQIKTIKNKSPIYFLKWIDTENISYSMNHSSLYSYSTKKNTEEKISFPGHFNKITSSILSKDKNYLITSSGDNISFPQDFTIKIWDPKSKNLIKNINFLAENLTCIFIMKKNNEISYAAIGCKDKFIIYNMGNEKITHSSHLPESKIVNLSFCLYKKLIVLINSYNISAYIIRY